MSDDIVCIDLPVSFIQPAYISVVLYHLYDEKK
jgi:hypothetical protein